MATGRTSTVYAPASANPSGSSGLAFLSIAAAFVHVCPGAGLKRISSGCFLVTRFAADFSNSRMFRSSLMSALLREILRHLLRFPAQEDGELVSFRKVREPRC